MKKQLLFIAAVISAKTSVSQAPTNTFPSTGNVGIGTLSPATILHTNQSAVGLNEVGSFINPDANGKPYIQVGHYAPADINTGAIFGFDYPNTRAFIGVAGDDPTTGVGMILKRYGYVGIGNNNPLNKLEVTSSTGGEGITINQTGSGAAGFQLNASSGSTWKLYSCGTSDGWGGANHFAIERNNDNPAFFIHGTEGNVGISTISPGYAKLKTQNTDPIIPSGVGGTRWGILGTIAPQQAKISDGLDESDIGVEGDATTTFTGEQILYGVVGRGSNGLNNYGGYFEATLGDNTKTGAANFGVRAKATGNYRSYGVYSEASGAAVQNWAGYFQGDVNINGSAFCTISAWSSDVKLKKDIKPITNGLEKIRLLKPSTYTFKNEEEFKYMNLPKEQQLGVIAQDIEKVFPYLVKEVPEDIQKDNAGKITIKVPAHKVVNYIGLIPVLISAIQQQDQISQDQQQQIVQQAQINADLKKQLDEHKQLLSEMQKSPASMQNSSDNGSITGTASSGNIETGFQMYQNEPNPFTGQTIVKYNLPATIHNAYMAIYDLTGKQITTLPITDRGSSSITLTSEKLAAGIYIYSIFADGKILDSKRMVVADK
jgi:hypothetical protein